MNSLRHRQKKILFIVSHWWEFNSRLHQSTAKQQQSSLRSKQIKWMIHLLRKEKKKLAWKIIHESMNQPSLFSLSSIYIRPALVHFRFQLICNTISLQLAVVSLWWFTIYSPFGFYSILHYNGTDFFFMSVVKCVRASERGLAKKALRSSRNDMTNASAREWWAKQILRQRFLCVFNLVN